MMLNSRARKMLAGPLTWFLLSCNFSLSWSFNANSITGRSASKATTSTTCLFDVPPPSTDDAVAFKEYASKQPPPASFFALQQDCVRSAKLATKDGFKLLEIEYPPLPANVLEMDDVSAYQVAVANLKLALDFAKGMLSSSDDEEKSDFQRAAILFPDESEKQIALDTMSMTDNPYKGIRIDALRQPDEDDTRVVKPEQVFLSLFGQGSGGAVKPIPGADFYIIIVASAQELPDIEELHQLEPDKPIFCFNLKLDILRGDLGAPAFPPKAFQDRFLSKVKPVYYLRTRQYSRSTPSPPFIVNYQGCLFRAYPGQYQTLLDTGTGRYRRLCGSDFRPPLGEFKEQLTEALKVQGLIKDEGGALEFLRTGYKTTTWWEEERENASDLWRT